MKREKTDVRIFYFPFPKLSALQGFTRLCRLTSDLVSITSDCHLLTIKVKTDIGNKNPKDPEQRSLGLIRF